MEENTKDDGKGDKFERRKNENKIDPQKEVTAALKLKESTAAPDFK